MADENGPAPYVPPVGAVLTTAGEVRKLPKGWTWSPAYDPMRRYEIAHPHLHRWNGGGTLLAWPPAPKVERVPWWEAQQPPGESKGRRHPEGGCYVWPHGVQNALWLDGDAVLPFQLIAPDGTVPVLAEDPEVDRGQVIEGPGEVLGGLVRPECDGYSDHGGHWWMADGKHQVWCHGWPGPAIRPGSEDPS